MTSRPGAGFSPYPASRHHPFPMRQWQEQIMPTLNLKIVSYGKTVEFMTTWPIKSNILTGRLSIYAVNGRKIVAFGILSGKSLQWDGKDALGRLVGPGVFIARLIIGSEDISKPFPIDL